MQASHSMAWLLLHRVTTASRQCLSWIATPATSSMGLPCAYLLLHLGIHASLACHHQLLDHLRGHLATHIQDGLPATSTGTHLLVSTHTSCTLGHIRAYPDSSAVNLNAAMYQCGCKQCLVCRAVHTSSSTSDMGWSPPRPWAWCRGLLCGTHLDTCRPPKRTADCSVVTALRKSPPDTCNTHHAESCTQVTHKKT
jgi:hypothetical protein